MFGLTLPGRKGRQEGSSQEQWKEHSHPDPHWIIMSEEEMFVFKAAGINVIVLPTGQGESYTVARGLIRHGNE